MGKFFSVYDFFNSRDIAKHCRKTEYSFTATEVAYIIRHSNHHTLAQKHVAWQEILDSFPDEELYPAWDFEGHTLHSFLRTYMRLQNEYITDFCETKAGYIYTYSTLQRYDDHYSCDNIFFDSYEACLETLKENELDDDPYDEIAKAKITRHRLYSSYVAFDDAQEQESVVFDKKLQILDIDPAVEQEDERILLSPCYGFDDMWVAIPTPFQRGDVVMDVNVYKERTIKHLPFVLDRIPYWKRTVVNGDNCEAEIERMLENGADWVDMQELAYFQDSNGEIYRDHAFNYLDLEYYCDELLGSEKLLAAVSDVIKGRADIAELLKNHSKYAGKLQEY